MNGSRRRVGAALVAGALLALTGCYEIVDSPDRAVIRFMPVWRFAMIVVPLAVIFIGLVLCCFRRWVVHGVVTIVATAALGVLIVPGMYLDTVVITPTEIKQTTGFWFAPTVNTVRYNEVRAITIQTVKKRKGQDARRWMIHQTDETTRELDPGDLWENNEDFVVQKLREYGVRVEQ